MERAVLNEHIKQNEELKKKIFLKMFLKMRTRHAIAKIVVADIGWRGTLEIEFQDTPLASNIMQLSIQMKKRRLYQKIIASWH
jgi:hypothetical protein